MSSTRPLHILRLQPERVVFVRNTCGVRTAMIRYVTVTLHAHLQAEDMERAHEHVQAALEHDETVETHQAQLGAMQEELKRLEDASQQVLPSP